MKRALAFTLMVLAIMIIAVSCEEPHVHRFATEWSYDDTYHWHASACGHEEEVSDKSVHVWKEGGDDNGWITEKEATETEKGSAYRICTVCEYKETKVIQELTHVHTYSAYDYNGSKHWRTCTGCGEKFTYTHSLTYKYDSATHHQECYCGYSTTNTDHSFGGQTAGDDGKTTQKCSICNYTKVLVSKVTEEETISSSDTTTEGDKTVVTRPVTITATVSAIDNTNSSSDGNENKTIVVFPTGALKSKSDISKISLTITAIPATEVSKDTTYKVTETETGSGTLVEKAVVAGFEFILGGADSGYLTGKDGSGTTVETYISPNLGKVEDIKIKFIGEETVGQNKATVNEYNSSNGYLKFTVYHFSKYAIVSTNIVAKDSSGNMYPTLAKAVSDAKDGATITLLKDTTEEINTTISVSKPLTLDLNQRTLTLKNTGNVVSAFKVSSTFTVKNGKEIVGGIDSTIFELTSSGRLNLYNVPCTDIYWYLKNTSAGTYTIDTLAQLRGLAKLVNGTAKNSNGATISTVAFSGKTITLGHDINMNKEEWTPIGKGTRDGSGTVAGCTPFKGTFDGDGHTIRNIFIGASSNEDDALGLFGVVDNGTINDLKFADVAIDALNSEETEGKKASECLGTVAGLMINGSTLSGVTVESGTIKSGQAGGLVGRMTISGKIENCINRATVEATASAAGIVSKAYYSEANEDGSLKGGINIIDCRNEGKITATKGGYTAGIAGMLAGNVTNCVNTGDITGTSTDIGGIVGELTNYGKISKCSNSGEIKNSATTDEIYGLGGIVGWARYQMSNYDYSAPIVIENNTNTGIISGGNVSVGAGGIVGMIYNTAKVNKNTNSAASISGNKFVSGIVGGHQVSGDNKLSEDEYISKTEIIGNESTTALKNITGNCKAAIIYLNDSKVTKVYSNTPSTNDSEANVLSSNVTTYYRTLNDAVKKASEGDSVTLLKDIFLESTSGENTIIELTMTLTLDLGGYTLGGNSGVLGVSGGTLTLKNGTIQCVSKYPTDRPNDNAVVKVRNNKSKVDDGIGLVLEEDAIINGLNCYGVSSMGKSDVTLDINGTINSAQACVSGNGDTDDWNDGGLTININEGAKLTSYGATLTNTNGQIIVGTDEEENKKYDAACAVYQPKVGGKLNVEGGKLTSKKYSAIEVRNGNAKITGGELVSEASYSVGETPKNGGPCVHGATVAVNYYGTGVDKSNNGITVEITGGTFTASSGKKLAIVKTVKDYISDTSMVKAVVADSLNFAEAEIFGTKGASAEGKTTWTVGTTVQ